MGENRGMADPDWLAEQFESERPRLRGARAVAEGARVFAHIVGVLGLYAGLALDWATILRLRRAQPIS
jgi:hypothetical protein